MKRFLSMALALLLCVILCSCSSAKSELVGQWVALESDAAATFNENGTGTLFHYWGSDALSVTWKYDDELSCYVIATPNMIATNLQNENGICYITLPEDIKLYRPSEKEAALQANRESELAELHQELEQMLNIQQGTAYECAPGIQMAFTQITLEDDRIHVALSLTNNTEETIDSYDYIPSDLLFAYTPTAEDFSFIEDSQATSWCCDHESASELLPGQSKTYYQDFQGYLDPTGGLLTEDYGQPIAVLVFYTEPDDSEALTFYYIDLFDLSN